MVMAGMSSQLVEHPTCKQRGAETEKGKVPVLILVLYAPWKFMMKDEGILTS